MWDDWLAFQVKVKKKREADKRQKVLDRQRLIDRIKDVLMIILVVALLGGLGVIVGTVIWYARDV
jgi:predicted RNase H-like nuclease